jgi:hypothetical protein
MALRFQALSELLEGAAPLGGCVVDVRNPSELQQVCEVAQRNRTQLSFLASGNTLLHQAQPNCLHVRYKDESLILDELSGSVRVGCSVTMATLEHHLNRHGRSLPVLTSAPSSSIGGVLSVGGFGESSYRFGAVADLVEEIDVAYVTGEIASYTRDDTELGLFIYARGLVGVITGAKLRTIPLPSGQILYSSQYGSLLELVRAFLDVDAHPDSSKLRYAKGQLWGGQYLLTMGFDIDDVPVTGGIEEFFMSSASKRISTTHWHQRVLGLERDFKGTTHVWQDYVFSSSTVEGFAALCDEVVKQPSFSRYQGRVLVLFIGKSVKSNAGLLRPFLDDGLSKIGLGIYLEVPEGDAAGRIECEELHRRLLTRALASRGMPYTVGTLRFSEEELIDIFGRNGLFGMRERIQAAPNGLITSSLLVTPSK